MPLHMSKQMSGGQRHLLCFQAGQWVPGENTLWNLGQFIEPFMLFQCKVVTSFKFHMLVLSPLPF